MPFPPLTIRMIATGALLALGAAAAAAQSPAPVARAADDPGLEWGACPDFMPEGCAIAVLHGDPAQPGADVLFRVPGGARIVRHWHGSAERMVLVAGELEATYDGHPPTTLSSGDYAWGPPRLPHSAHCRSSTPCVLFIAFDQAVDAHEGAPPE